MIARLEALAAAAVLPLVVACSGEVVIQPNDETRLLATQAGRAQTWEPTEQDPVTLHADVPSTVRHGDPVPIRITLRNGTARPVAIGFRKEQGFDVVVTRAGVSVESGAVWSPMRLSEVSGDVTITDPLRAGRDTTLSATWPGADDAGHIVPRGRYQIRAVVTAGLRDRRQMWTPWMPVEVQ